MSWKPCLIKHSADTFVINCIYNLATWQLNMHSKVLVNSHHWFIWNGFNTFQYNGVQHGNIYRRDLVNKDKQRKEQKVMKQEKSFTKLFWGCFCKRRCSFWNVITFLSVRPGRFPACRNMLADATPSRNWHKNLGQTKDILEAPVYLVLGIAEGKFWRSCSTTFLTDQALATEIMPDP